MIGLRAVRGIPDEKDFGGHYLEIWTCITCKGTSCIKCFASMAGYVHESRGELVCHCECFGALGIVYAVSNMLSSSDRKYRALLPEVDESGVPYLESRKGGDIGLDVFVLQSAFVVCLRGLNDAGGGSENGTSRNRELFCVHCCLTFTSLRTAVGRSTQCTVLFVCYNKEIRSERRVTTCLRRFAGM